MLIRATPVNGYYGKNTRSDHEKSSAEEAYQAW